MRLFLRIPERAPRREIDDDTSVVVLAGDWDRPVATLTLVHPRIAPMSVIEWANDMTRFDLPQGMVATLLSSTVETTQTGWAMQVVHSTVAPPGETTPVEVRLTAIVRFHPYQVFISAAIARIHDPARFEELRPSILELFQTARPDWKGREVAALAELYD